MTMVWSRWILASVPLWAKAGSAMRQASAASSSVLAVWKGIGAPGAGLGLLRQHAHGLFQAGERGGVHAVVHQLFDDLDRLAVLPDFLGLRVQPDALVVDVGDALYPDRAGFLVEVLDRAARSEERRVGKECRSGWSPYQ